MALGSAIGRDPIELAIGGGEDYVLLFTLPPGLAPPRRFLCHRIGDIVAARGVHLESDRGSTAIDQTGWDHLAAKRAGQRRDRRSRGSSRSRARPGR
jgi:thiamine monophosphate kinase